MQKTGLLGNHNPASQLLVLLGIALVSVAVFSFISILLANPLFGINVMANPGIISQFSNPAVVSLLKFMQTLQSFGLFVLPPMLFAFVYYRNILGYLQLNVSFTFMSLVLIIVVMFFALPLINWMGEINAHLKLPAAFAGIEQWMKNSEEQAEQLTKVFLNMNTKADLLFDLLMVAVIPAIGEEFLFRGVLQKIFIDWTKNKHAGIWITAILFSAMHLQFYGFVPRMMLGALFGYAYLWTGSLWIPIIGHFINNGAAVFISYLEQHGKVNPQLENIGSANDEFIMVLVSFVFVTGLLFLLWKQRKKESEISLL